MATPSEFDELMAEATSAINSIIGAISDQQQLDEFVDLLDAVDVTVLTLFPTPLTIKILRAIDCIVCLN